eukprot:14109281-Alexandrium_andersonii.AAC.1
MCIRDSCRSPRARTSAAAAPAAPCPCPAPASTHRLRQYTPAEPTSSCPERAPSGRPTRRSSWTDGSGSRA